MLILSVSTANHFGRNTLHVGKNYNNNKQWWLLLAMITSVIITSHVIFKNKDPSCDVGCAELLPFDVSPESCAVEQIIFHLSPDFSVCFLMT